MTRKTTPYGRRKARLERRGVRMAQSGITLLNMLNTRLTRQEIDRIIGPCKVALQAFREARGEFAHWVTLCTANHVGTAIEDGGVMRGQRDIFNDAGAALDSIGTRCGREAGEWKPKACTGPEITALADMIAAHSRQAHELTYGEYTEAADKAVARVETARGQVFKNAEPDTTRQLDPRATP